MKTSSRVWVDLMKTDDARRVILTGLGTRRDFERLGIDLQEGVKLQMYTDDADAEGRPDPILVDGVARFDQDNNRWVAEIDWDHLVHRSEV